MDTNKKIQKALAIIKKPVIGEEAYLILGNGGRVRTSDVVTIFQKEGETQIETLNTVYVINNKPWFVFDSVLTDMRRKKFVLCVRTKVGTYVPVEIEPTGIEKYLKMDQCAIETQNAVYCGDLRNGDFITDTNKIVFGNGRLIPLKAESELIGG